MQQVQFPLPQPPLQRPAGGGKAALQYGLIFGGVISLVDILYAFLADNGTLTWYYGLVGPLEKLPDILYYAVSGLIVGAPIYVLLFVAFFLAGILAARSAKTVASGVLAGLLAGGVFLIFDLFVATLLMNLLVVFPPLASSMPASDVAQIETSILMNSIIYCVIMDIILLGVGALIGFLGALIGNSGNKPPTMPYVYPGQPPAYAYPYAQPGQPLPPAQPGQPPTYPPSPEQ